MATKTRVFKNETKVAQVFYDRHLNPTRLMPGEAFTEDMGGAINVKELIDKEKERARLAADVEEGKRIRRKLAQVKVAASIEDLDKLGQGETSQDVLDAILLREKEMLNVENGRSEG
jgi:hypothetical protein